MSTNKKTLIDGDFQVGSGHLIVDTENNYVGFNNATPQNKIDVQVGQRTGTHSTGKPLYVTGVTSTSGAEFVSDDGTAGIGIGSSNIFTTEVNQNITIAPNGTGSLGIKTDTPNPSGETFDLWVQGDTKITGNVTAGHLYGDGSALTNISGTQWSSSSENIYFLNNTGSGEGKVGIGKTVPEYKLDILDSNKPTIRVKSTSTGDGDALLILDSSATGESDIDFNHDGALNWRIRTGDAAPSGLSFQINNANDSDVLTIQQNGNVGIGTDLPNVPLEVNKSAGGEMLRLATSTGTIYAGADANPPWFGTSSDDHLRLMTNGTEKVRIESGGNVGIGVTDPDSKLEVRGNIRASFSDTNHGMFIDAGGTILRNYDGANGAGLHFSANQIFPTNYLGSYSAGGIDLGSSTYRWNNVYTEALNASGTVTASSFSGIQVSDVPTLNQDTTGQAGTIAGQANSATITASADAGNNTIVRRSSSGYIFANYFNTTPDDVSTGVTKVCVETGNDGYIRHGTSAAISSFLGLANSATIEATTEDTANKIALRNASGDIFARLFRSDYQNQSTCTGAMAFRTSTTDNYIRFCSDTSAIRTFLGLANSATITASADAGNNTIVRRHSSGYIFCNYINTTDNAISDNVSAVMCKQGNDYHRSADAGAVNSFLGSFTNFFRRNAGNDVDVRINAGHGRGVRFWDSDSYKIYMSSATDANWGGRKDSSDYNMYFRMTGGTTRGFVFLNNRTVKCHINGSGDLYLDGGWLRTYGSRGWYSQSYGGGWFMQDTTYVRCYNNKTVYTAGAFLAGGNVTAYSDIRRKKDLLKIDNALDKVEQLTGYTYTNKKDNKRYTGLIAQDVEKVLPEAVTTETDGHLSLAYGNMMGLLVEAVKELTRKNEILEARLNAIENNT